MKFRLRTQRKDLMSLSYCERAYVSRAEANRKALLSDFLRRNAWCVGTCKYYIYLLYNASFRKSSAAILDIVKELELEVAENLTKIGEIRHGTYEGK